MVANKSVTAHYPYSVHIQHAVKGDSLTKSFLEERDSLTLRHVVFSRRDQRVSAAAKVVPTVSNASMLPGW